MLKIWRFGFIITHPWATRKLSIAKRESGLTTLDARTYLSSQVFCLHNNLDWVFGKGKIQIGEK